MAPPKAGLKNGLKAVGQAVSKAQFVNVPLLRTPMSYTVWLTRLLNTPRNLKTAARCVKSDIDELYHQQASKQFKNQSELLKKALAETTTRASEDAWKRAQLRLDCIAVQAIADQVAELRLPHFREFQRINCEAPEDLFKTQKYCNFANQVKQMNPQVVFTKDVMDTAFRSATSKLSKNAFGGTRLSNQRANAASLPWERIEGVLEKPMIIEDCDRYQHRKVIE